MSSLLSGLPTHFTSPSVIGYHMQAYILDVADPAILESIDAQLRGQEFSALAEYYLGA